MARKLGETDERIFAVAAWRDAPYFTEAERAALALTEAATRLSDRAEAVPDARARVPGRLSERPNADRASPEALVRGPAPSVAGARSNGGAAGGVSRWPAACAGHLGERRSSLTADIAS